MLLVLQSVLCIVLVVFLGTWLSQSADVLAEKTALGRSWVGAVLLAGATSLPELATGVSAVVVFDAPELAAGGIFGSCLFNLLLLALLDIFSGPEPLLKQAQIGHTLAAGLGIEPLPAIELRGFRLEVKYNLSLGLVYTKQLSSYMFLAFGRSALLRNQTAGFRTRLLHLQIVDIASMPPQGSAPTQDTD